MTSSAGVAENKAGYFYRIGKSSTYEIKSVILSKQS